jgi:hypothetical protein
MRTTVQIDNDLLRTLKEQAHREGTSLAKLINQVLRRGISAADAERKPPRGYREKTFAMGAAKVPLDKALALADALADDELQEKLLRRK